MTDVKFAWIIQRPASLKDRFRRLSEIAFAYDAVLTELVRRLHVLLGNALESAVLSLSPILLRFAYDRP